jgi:peptidyl-prolyl cis-trans isomerase C
VRRTRAALWLLSVIAAAGACRQAPPPAASPGAAGVAQPLPSPLPEIVARVNGQPITARLLEFVANEGSLRQKISPEKQPEAYRKALASLVERELLFQEALARGLRADDRAVEAGYDQLHAQYPNEEAWKASLARQGLDEAGFRLEVRARMTVQALVNAEAGKEAAVTEAEARAHYDAHPAEFDTGDRCQASHIFLDAKGVDPAALRQRAQAVLARLRKGEDLAKVAREVSQDPSSASRGGELPEMSRAQMDPALAEAIFKLKAGETSDVIVTPYGATIVRMRTLLPARRLGFDEVRARIMQRLQADRRREAVNRLVQGLRAKASIESAF